jgi:transcription elongation factor GreA
MSKAFTKEDDDGGFVAPSSSRIAIPAGPFRITATGAALLRTSVEPSLVGALARAEVLPPREASPDRAGLGVTVLVRRASGEERRYRLVTPEEHALLNDGCSVQSPLGRALLGAQAGDVRELHAPRAVEELEIVALAGEEDGVNASDA